MQFGTRYVLLCQAAGGPSKTGGGRVLVLVCSVSWVFTSKHICSPLSLLALPLLLIAVLPVLPSLIVLLVLSAWRVQLYCVNGPLINSSHVYLTQHPWCVITCSLYHEDQTLFVLM